jgi:5-methylcytosine-specific restriction endonuclease McrA
MNVITRKEAKKRGLTRYFVNKPCPKGHVSEHKVSNYECVACHKLYETSYNAVYRTVHKKELTQKKRQYYLTNRDVIINKTLKWQKDNPDKVSQKIRNRRCLKRASSGEYVNYSIVWMLCDGYCYLCGQSINKNQVVYDHVIPLSRGGAHSYDNLRAVHRSCNCRKGTKTPLEFYRYLKELEEIPSESLELTINGIVEDNIK